MDGHDLFTDEPQLESWLHRAIPGLRGSLSAVRVEGGRSNLTYIITDAHQRRVVLRRPPLGHVLPSAHDVLREYRIQQALMNTPVPVAPMLAAADANGPIGAPFYVMDFMPGVILREEHVIEEHFLPQARGAIGDHLVDALADLHAVSPDAVGLGDLGRRENYVERQLRRWNRQIASVEDRQVPVLIEVGQRLAAAVPPQRRTSIVHGDFRLDNCLIGLDSSVVAVLDWELCTLGDPLADLGLLMVYWPRPGSPAPIHSAAPPTYLDGFREPSELIDRYVARTGIDVAELDLDYFTAFGFWKLACIFEGIRVRYAAGVMAADPAEGEPYGVQAIELGEAALAITDSFSRRVVRD